MTFENILKQKGLYEIFNKFIKKKSLKEVLGKYAYLHEGRKYSFRNVILAWSQADNLGIDFQGTLKGFNQWKHEGIYINKGSKGLKILIPFIKKDDDETNKLKKEGWSLLDDNPMYYMTGLVFDVSQTSNYEKDKIEHDKIIYETEEIPFNKAMEISLKITKNIKIDFEHNERGSFNTQTKEIILKNESGETLLHEIGHYLSYDIIDKKDKDKYAKDEVLAEITAFLIKSKLGYFNINPNYSNIWSSRIEDLKIKELFKAVEIINKKVENIIRENK